MICLSTVVMRLAQVEWAVVNDLLRQQLWLGTLSLSRYTLSMQWAELWPLRRMVLFSGDFIFLCLNCFSSFGSLLIELKVLIVVNRLVTGLSFICRTLLALTNVPNSMVTCLVPALGLGLRVDKLPTTSCNRLREALRRLANDVNLVPLLGTLKDASYRFS